MLRNLSSACLVGLLKPKEVSDRAVPLAPLLMRFLILMWFPKLIQNAPNFASSSLRLLRCSFHSPLKRHPRRFAWCWLTKSSFALKSGSTCSWLLVGCFLVGCSVFQTPENSGNNLTVQNPRDSEAQNSSNVELSTDSKDHTGVGQQLQAPEILQGNVGNLSEILIFDRCRRLQGGSAGLVASEFKVNSGDASTLYGRGTEGQLFSYSASKLCPARWGAPGSSAQITRLALSAKGDALALASAGVVRVFELPSGKPLAVLKSSEAVVTALEFASASDSLFIARADGFIYRWAFLETTQFRERGLEPLQRYTGLSSIPSALALHPTGRFFLSADWSGSIYAWMPYDQLQFSSRYQENVFAQQGWFAQPASVRGDARSGLSPVEHLSMLADGKLFLAARRDGVLELWRVRGFQKVNEVKVHEGEVISMAIDPSGTKVATVGRDGGLRVWTLIRRAGELSAEEPSTLSLLREWSDMGANAVLFRSASRLLVSSRDGSLKEYTL